jgi:hypothetical protein
MKRIATYAWLSSGLLILLLAVAINPAHIVHHFLSASMTRYEADLVRGLLITKALLLLDGILCLSAPLLARWVKASAHETTLVAASDPISRAELAIIGAVTFMGALLRLYHLGVGFSYDETVISMSMMEKSIPYLLARAEVWRTLYALCGHVLYAILGRSEAVAHIPAFLSGVATIPALYLLVRKCLGKQEAFWSAAFLAVSGFHIWYSQIATSYSMALFFSLLSMVLLPRGLTTQYSRPWIGWGTVVFLALYSHFFVAAFAIMGEAAYVTCLLFSRQISWRSVKQFLIALTFAGALFVTLASPNLPVYMNILSGLGGSTNAEFVQAEPRGTVIGQLGLFGQWLFQPYAPSWLQWYGVSVAAIGLCLLWKRSRTLTIYLCLPTVLLWVIFATGLMRRITPRHSIFTLVPVCILLSVCAAAAVKRAFLASKRFQALAVPLLMSAPLLLASVVSLSTYYQRERSAFRPTSTFLKENTSLAETTYIGGFGFDAFHYYTPTLHKIATYSQLEALLESPKPFWLVVYTDSFLREMPPSLHARLQNRGTPRFDYVAFPEQYADPCQSVVWYIKSPDLSRTADAN